MLRLTAGCAQLVCSSRVHRSRSAAKSTAYLSPLRKLVTIPGRRMAAASGAADQQLSAPGSGPETSGVKYDLTLQYVILRRDLWAELEWPLGSVVAQACHAATAALWLSREDPVAQIYCAPHQLDHMHKVVLEVKDEEQLRNLSAKLAEAGVRHKLWVEQPEAVATCVATAPYPKSAVAPLVKKLKLCKWG